jgi:hypothetical protein
MWLAFFLYSTKLVFVESWYNNYQVSIWGKLLQKAMDVVLLVVHLQTCTLEHIVDV